MTDFIGNLGGIQISAESTWNWPVTPAIELWCIGSTLKPTHEIIETEHLSFAPQNFTGYTPQYSLGEITSHFTFDTAIMTPILGNLAAGAADVYTIGEVSTPDNPGLSILQNTGGSAGMAYTHTGCKINQLTIDVEPNKYPKLTMAVIGGTCAVGTPATITLPAISQIAHHSDFATITYAGGTTLGCRSAQVTIERPLSGADRTFVGASTLTEPVQTGPFKIGATLNVDLSDTTDRNSEAVLELFRAGTTLGTISLGSGISLTNCRMVGDWPSLGEGIQQFPINVVATEIEIDIS